MKEIMVEAKSFNWSAKCWHYMCSYLSYWYYENGVWYAPESCINNCKYEEKWGKYVARKMGEKNEKNENVSDTTMGGEEVEVPRNI